MTTLQSERLHNMLHHIAVEAFAAHLLNHCSQDIEPIVAVFIAGAGFVIVVALSVVGVFIRVHRVEALPVALRVVEARGVAHQHFGGNHHIGIFGIAHFKLQILIHVGSQVHLTFFGELHNGSGGKRFGNAGDAENGIGSHILTQFAAFQAKTVGVGNFVVFHHHHIGTHHFQAIHHRGEIRHKSRIVESLRLLQVFAWLGTRCGSHQQKAHQKSC